MADSTALRFSQDGPEFPGQLVDSLLRGEVVFLCGTGISAPPMPNFSALVNKVYETLDVQKTDSEKNAFARKQFEEVLGSLSRRLSDPESVTRQVSEFLKTPAHPNLERHRTILRLSRNPDNRIAVITTNFDTMLEKAANNFTKERNISFAGQALPTPGSPSFSGIIHIHGRLADPELGLEQTPLVLTSADYGDAYMRSGWASRFLFDLARCKVLVLVGYSANDAPIRYFLNVIEADRARFPDLKEVYAFGAYQNTPEGAIHSWGILPVTPLPYSKRGADTGEDDHSSLWRDLAELVNLAEHPKHWRQKQAREILERPAANATAISQGNLNWIFSGRRDLWSVALCAITDPEWFRFFRDKGLLSEDEKNWVPAGWIVRDLQDIKRFEFACKWQQDIGQSFTEKIKQKLRQRKEYPSKTWTRVWRLFCLAKSVQHDYEDGLLTHYAIKKLKSGIILDSDLQEAVNLLAPRLELSQNHNGSQQIRELSDIVCAHMFISDPDRTKELVNTLLDLAPDHARQILDLATAELRSVLHLETELELIDTNSDINDFAVPSIEDHAQNQYYNHEGVLFLVQALVQSLPQSTSLERDHTRRVVTGWKSFPGRLGLRLCLHAMRDTELFSVDEAMETLLSAPEEDFWSIRRETALLLKDRASTAVPGIMSQIEKRICQDGNDYFYRYPIEPGQVDWREHERDTEVWLRLRMLQDAGVLSDIGAKELSTIIKRRDYLNRAMEDRDFFGTCDLEFRPVVSDPSPFMKAPERDRLRIAHELSHSPKFELREGWLAFCRADPQGAFDCLSKSELTPENEKLWNQFLIGLKINNREDKEIQKISMQALEHLSMVDADILQTMITGLCDLLHFLSPKERIRGIDDWLEKLWTAISKQPEKAIDPASDLYEIAINSPAGKLSATLLIEIEGREKKGKSLAEIHFQLLRDISSHEGVVGQLGRSVLACNLAFLLTVDRKYVTRIFAPRINSDDLEGEALRAVMLRYGMLTPETTQVFKETIKKGVAENKSTDSHIAAVIASNILDPVLVAELREDNSAQWGLTETDVNRILRETSPSIRNGALKRLMQLLQYDQADAEEAWRKMGVPFFERMWPKERKFRDVSHTPFLIDIAVGAGEEFPATLKVLKPYISPYEGGYGYLDSIVRSKAPERFPQETLDLLWLVCGPTRSRKNSKSFYAISKIIDRLIEAEPDIEIDRRLQWLEQHAERYD